MRNVSPKKSSLTDRHEEDKFNLFSLRKYGDYVDFLVHRDIIIISYIYIICKEMTEWISMFLLRQIKVRERN